MQFQTGAVRPVGSIEEGWNLIKDSYGTFFAMTLVALIVLIAAAMILGFINNMITFAISAAFGAATQNSGDAGKLSAAIVPQMISMVISIFTNVIVLTVSGALFCGIYSALSRKADTGIAEFGDLFNGFQKVLPCFIVAVVISIVQFVIGVVTLLGGAAVGVSALGLGVLTGEGRPNPAMFGSIFLVLMIFVIFSIAINLIISALTAFVYPLIAERDLSGGQALLLSAKSGLGNIGGIILLLILLGLIAFAGLLACLIGFFFVAPILSAALFSAFRSVFGKTADTRRHTPPSPPVFGQQPGY